MNLRRVISCCWVNQLGSDKTQNKYLFQIYTDLNLSAGGLNNFHELCIFVKSFPGFLARVDKDLGGKDKSWLLTHPCQKDGREAQIEAQIDGNKTSSVAFRAVLLHDGKTKTKVSPGNFDHRHVQRVHPAVPEKGPGFQKAFNNYSPAGCPAKYAPKITTHWQKSRLNSSIPGCLQDLAEFGII